MKPRTVCLLLAWSWLAAGLSPAAEPVEVTAAIERDEVFVGESFIFQIQVKGRDQAEVLTPPDLPNFTVTFSGTKPQHSVYETNFNGQKSRVEIVSCLLNYEITAKRAGEFRLPSLKVKVDGKIYETPPAVIRVREPEKQAGMVLRQELSTPEACVGQPVTLTLSFVVRTNQLQVGFTAPYLNDSRFIVVDPEAKLDPNKTPGLVALSLNGESAVFHATESRDNAGQLVTLTTRRILIPREAGEYALSGAAAAGVIQVVSGGSRRRDPLFDHFFNDPFFNQNLVKRRFAVPSDPLKLTVKPLPPAGRPADFTGLVGEYSLVADVSPAEAKVGDPLTLTIRVAGPDYLANVDWAALGNLAALEPEFRLPAELPAPTDEGAARTFTVTIRAADTNVKAVPALGLSYFSPRTGRYETARTQPLPLKIESARVVTAGDAEGTTAAGPLKNELENLAAGIAHNYAGENLLADEGEDLSRLLRRPLWLVALLGPPLFNLLAFVVLRWRAWREGDPRQRRRRQALSNCLSQLAVADTPEAGLAALRQYLADRLGCNVLTFADAEGELAVLPEAVQAQLKQAFAAGEAASYAGSGNSDDGYVKQVRAAVEMAERAWQ